MSITLEDGFLMEMVALSVNSQWLAPQDRCYKLNPFCSLKVLPRCLLFPSHAPFSSASFLFSMHSRAPSLCSLSLLKTHFQPLLTRCIHEHLILILTLCLWLACLEKTLWHPSLDHCPTLPLALSFHWKNLSFLEPSLPLKLFHILLQAWCLSAELECQLNQARTLLFIPVIWDYARYIIHA